MAQPYYTANTEEYTLKSGLAWSLGIHIIFIGAIAIKSLIFPSVIEPYIPTLRVDIVGLPDILKKDIKDIPPVVKDDPKKEKIKNKNDAIKEAARAAKNEMVIKKKKARKREKARLKKLKAERENKKQKALARIKALNKLTNTAEQKVKGNILSKGTVLTGDAKEAASASYYDIILTRVKSNWELPVWIARHQLSAKVVVRIDKRGRIIGYKFLRPSGNRQFDDAVRRALNKSNPFPPPDAGIASTLLTDGVLLGFPL